MTQRSALFIVGDGVIGAPGAAEAIGRLAMRGVSVIAFGSLDQQGLTERLPRPQALASAIAAAARRHGADLFGSWLVTDDPAALRAAATAGCQGAVLVGEAPLPKEDLGIVLAQARDLADAPRVMIPKNGGCWHN